MNFCLIVIAGAVSVSAFAADYDAQVQRIRTQSNRIQTHLRQLGIKTTVDDDAPFLDPNRPQKVAPMFEIHGDFKTRQAQEGSFIFGKLVNRLVVSSDEHPAIVELLTDQGVLSGLRIRGVARQSSNPERIQIDFTKIILRSGKAAQISASALDQNGALGLKADVFSGKALAVAGSMAGSFITGLAAGSQSQTTNGLGFTTVQSTGRNALLQGVAQTAADGSKRLLEEATKEKPVLIVEPGTEVSIFFNEEVRL